MPQEGTLKAEWRNTSRRSRFTYTDGVSRSFKLTVNASARTLYAATTISILLHSIIIDHIIII